MTQATRAYKGRNSPFSGIKDNLVVLVHGFNKGPRDMRYLADYLQQQGYKTVSVNLPTLFGSIEDCVAALDKQLSYYHQQGATFHFVAHSMGGLVVRRWWQLYTKHQPAHSVFIATPHKGSALASFAIKIPGYGLLFKPVHALLPDAGFAPRCEAPPNNLGLIAGTKSFGLLTPIWLKEPNDGRVEVAAVICEDADASIELPFNHKQIHHRPETAHQVTHFLKHGVFNSLGPS